MLHTFKCLDRFLLLDIESGAVHVVDEITHDVAKLYEDHDRSEIIAGLPQYTAAEIDEVLQELRPCEKEGQALCKGGRGGVGRSRRAQQECCEIHVPSYCA